MFLQKLICLHFTKKLISPCLATKLTATSKLHRLNNNNWFDYVLVTLNVRCQVFQDITLFFIQPIKKRYYISLELTLGRWWLKPRFPEIIPSSNFDRHPIHIIIASFAAAYKVFTTVPTFFFYIFNVYFYTHFLNN